MPASAFDQNARREPRLMPDAGERSGANPGSGGVNDKGLGSLAAKLLSDAKARVLENEKGLQARGRGPQANRAPTPVERATRDARAQTQDQAAAATRPSQLPGANGPAQAAPAQQLRSVAQAISQRQGVPQQQPQLRAVPRHEPAAGQGGAAAPSRVTEPTGNDDVQPPAAPQRVNSDPDYRPRESVLAPRGTISARHYVQSLNSRLRDEKTSQMRNAMTQVEKEEINALIRMLARTRGRHAASLLELAKTDRPIKGQLFDEVRSLRLQIEEMEAGLELLKASVLDGSMNVRGVLAEDM